MDRNSTGNLTVQVRLHGSIVGRGVENVSVRIISTKPPTRHFESPITFTEKTSFRGDALFKDIPLGQYDVHVEADGYTRKTVRAAVKIPGPDPQGHFVTPHNAVYVKLEAIIIEIKFSPTAKVTDVTEYSLNVLKDILFKANIKSVTISSTGRDATNQARVMYDLIEQRGGLKGGTDYAKNLYGINGGRVIDVYKQMKKEGKSADEIKAGMKNKIDELGATNVSAHAADPKVLNVFDIAPSSMSNRSQFEAMVAADKRVRKFLKPPSDPGYHLEIPQPQSQTKKQ